MEQLAEKVKELRSRKGWTRKDLAQEIDVSPSTVHRWEEKGAVPFPLALRELNRLFQEAEIGVL